MKASARYVEKVAQVMAESDRCYWNRTVGGTSPTWEDLSATARAEYRRLARVAIEVPE
jgi:hypothetical protein